MINLWFRPSRLIAVFLVSLLVTLGWHDHPSWAQRQANSSGLLTLYQTIQNLPWEGQFTTVNGTVYFSNRGQALVEDYSSADLQRSAIAYHVNSQYDQAINRYLQGLAQAKEARNHNDEIVYLANLGLAYAASGFYYEAVDYLNQNFALTWHRAYYYRGTDPKLGGMALGNIGRVYLLVDLYLKAIEVQERRFKLSQEIQDREGEARALADLGLIYQAIGDYDRAIDQQQKSLEIARTLRDIALMQQATANLGIVYHATGDYGRAAQLQRESLELARQRGDRPAQIQALGNLGGAYYFMGDLDRAIELYERAIQIAFEINESRMSAIINCNLGLARFLRGDLRSDDGFYNQLMLKLNSQARLQVGRLGGTVRNNYGVMAAEYGQPAKAEKLFTEGMEQWETARQNLGNNDAYKVSFLETQGAIYKNLQRFLIQQNRPEAALEIAERGRARVFVELLARNLAPNQGTIRPVTPITIAQIKAVAQEQKATLVEYSILYEEFLFNTRAERRESELLIWVVQPTGQVSLRRVGLKPLWQQQRTSLTDLVDRSRDALGISGRGSLAYTRWLRQLYQILIEPVADLLPSTPGDRIVFIPQGQLFLLSFNALQDSQGQYLIDRYTLQTTPSIQVLQLTRLQRNRTHQTGAVVVGNPTMPLVTLPGSPPQRLEPLPGAEKEAQAIAQLLNTTPLIGAVATKAAVLRQMQNSGVIHLATHGLLDDFSSSGIPGAIALAPASQDSGLLTASEILNQRIRSRLVVLSACDTGRGRISGDGVIGLSRSFIAAGAASVLVSLWAVPDTPTAELMQEFYQQLQVNPDQAQALRQAIRQTKQKHPHPKDWAAFTLIGENI